MLRLRRLSEKGKPESLDVPAILSGPRLGPDDLEEVHSASYLPEALGQWVGGARPQIQLFPVISTAIDRQEPRAASSQGLPGAWLGTGR